MGEQSESAVGLNDSPRQVDSSRRALHLGAQVPAGHDSPQTRLNIPNPRRECDLLPAGDEQFTLGAIEPVRMRSWLVVGLGEQALKAHC